MVFSPDIQVCIRQTSYDEALSPERRHENLPPRFEPKPHLQNRQKRCGWEDKEPHPGNWYVLSLSVIVQEISLPETTLLKIHKDVL